jgi:nicotinate-nucleotide pyrophosphorylase (carboxylating)
MLSVTELIHIALAEDIGPKDITTENLVSPNQMGKGMIVAKEPLVLAGMDVVREVFLQLDARMTFNSPFNDGDTVEIGDTVLEIYGPMRTLLLGERTALNFLQHLSGIATHVRGYVTEIGEKPVRLTDTRKTTPGLRNLEKYAVRVGGAYNHRMGLYDGVLIKDNHIAAYGGIIPAVEKIRDEVSHLVKIEVETADLAQVRDALKAGADVIMLDNMNIDQIKEAVAEIKGRAIVEVSGGVNRDNLAALADTGVDIISVGALTHSARSVDLSMRIQPGD